MIGAFSGLLFRLWDVQITNQSLYAGQLSSTRTITVREPGVRGKIKDRSGHTLVSNRLEYQLVLNLRVIAEDYDPAEHAHRDKNGNPMTPRVTQTRVRNGLSDSREVKDIATIVEETVIAPLAEMELAIDYTDSLRRQIANHYDMTDPAGLVPYTLPLALSYRRFAMLSERSLEIVGLQAKAAPVRNYDYGSLACHVLGYVRTADRAKDLEDLKQRAAGEGKEAVEAKRWLDYDHVYEPDPFGVLAIEKSSDQELKGRAGFREHLIDQKGIYVRDTKHESAQQGLDVRLTLDLRAQYIVESALRKANGGRGVGRGAAVLIDPNTGGILAMASVPTVDPNKFIPAISQDDFDVYNANKAKPFLNRSVGAYATGSVFKVAIALAGSLAEVENYRTVCTGGVTYGNRRIKCMGHHGTIGLQRAIMKSCNSFFYRYGNQSGIDNIISVTDMMGLGQKFNLPIEENGQTLIPSKSWLEETKPGAKWTDALTAQVSIGQGGVATSPLQMAQVAAVVA
ncbi:MAG: penicillin-binding transpeptidase domain-containing protein, partial [Verrucomicrobiales bacterium]